MIGGEIKMNKRYSEKTFEISKNLQARCWSENTRYGFRHLAELERDYRTVATNKACYYNRTWESYEFQSVLEGLAKHAKAINEITTREYNKFAKLIDNKFVKEDLKRVNKEFGMIGAIASLGNIFGKDQKESNDWKTRMLKAGLENRGLIMPDNWDELSEDDKQARLDGVISSFK
jgi:hypothetical protein